MPRFQRGLGVGVGTGRFSAPLGVSVGVDPSGAMIKVARERGVLVVRGVAERLPFGDEKFDLVLMVTVVFLLEDRATAFREAGRVLKPGGSIVVGFIDRDSPIGRRYQGEGEGKARKRRRKNTKAVFIPEYVFSPRWRWSPFSKRLDSGT